MQEMEIRPMTGQRRTNPGPTAGEPTASAAQARYRAFMAGNSGEDETRMQLDSYKAEILPIDPSMRNYLHELTVSVFWPHFGRMTWICSWRWGRATLRWTRSGARSCRRCISPWATDFAMCGMMVTTLRLQALGAGGRLLRRILRDCGGRDLRLSATRSGYRLYETAGFESVCKIWQHQGVARQIPPAGLRAGTPNPARAGAGQITPRCTHWIYGGLWRRADRGVGRDTGAVVGPRGRTERPDLRLRADAPLWQGCGGRPGGGGGRALAMMLAAPLIKRSEGEFCVLTRR